MAFRGKDSVRNKVVTNNKIIEQINTYNYLGYLLSYKKLKMFLINFQISYKSQESSFTF
jgi:hypothetical protein